MSEAIYLDLQKISQAGEDIKTQSTNMYNRLKEVHTLIKNTNNVYSSQSGEKFRKEFEKAAAKFEEFKKEVDKYGDFLINESAGRKKDDDLIAEQF